MTAHIAVLESADGEYDRDRSNVLSAARDLAYWRYRIARDASTLYVETTLDDGSLDDDDDE